MFRHIGVLFLSMRLLASAQEPAGLHPDVLPLPGLDDVPMTEDFDLDRSPDLLPPLGFLPDPALSVVPTVQDIKTRDLGGKVVDSVLSIRVWDQFGGQLAHGAGFYANDRGLVITDAGLLHPEIAARVDYITLTSPNGTNQKAEGFYLVDVSSGVALLQAEVTATTPLPLNTGADFSKPQPCHVVAVSEKRGLVLAPATIAADTSVTSLGWLPVKGAESPGAVGSPVLDDSGRVIAMVGMQVPLKSWMNFALDIDAAAAEARRKNLPLQPLTNLPGAPTIIQVVRSREFLDAFELLQNKRLEAALPRLVRLARKYPRNAECWALLGIAAGHLGGSAEAVSCQRKAVALDPKAGLYWQQLALSKLRDKSSPPVPGSSEDREALELATQQQPDDRIAWLLLATRRIQDGDIGQAAEALERLILLSPDYAHAHYLMAYVRGKKRDYDGAEQSIRRALNLNARSADAWYYQGLLSDKKGDLDTAIKAYQSTTRLKPDHKSAWMNLARTLKKAGRDTEARQAFLEHQKRTSGAR
ncbi:MAG: tetratricopeptide repeat protein [Verrucomicrobiaceae bacterium]|nr:tetratricopeptide repeat protein [Verrucomicrobiaceae bacterium]